MKLRPVKFMVNVPRSQQGEAMDAFASVAQDMGGMLVVKKIRQWNNTVSLMLNANVAGANRNTFVDVAHFANDMKEDTAMFFDGCVVPNVPGMRVSVIEPKRSQVG